MPSREDLGTAFDIVHYEARMLRHTSQLLASGALGDGALRNAVLESFLIHARGLDDFFYRDRQWSDDLLAGDFIVAPSSWVQVRPAKPQELQDVRERTGKEIAHLTYKRTPGVAIEKEWPFVAIRDALESVFEAFLTHVDRNALGDRLQAFTPGQTTVGSFLGVTIVNASTNL